MVLADVRLYQEGLARLLAADSRVLLVGPSRSTALPWGVLLSCDPT